MDTQRRKDLRDAYQSKALVGGVFGITCGGNGRTWIKSTKNMAGQQSRFAFSISVNTCPEPGMRKEWEQYGAQSFSFNVLESLTKKETQTEQEFAEDIGVLLEMWMEKHQRDAEG
jgi:hypothetical protein